MLSKRIRITRRQSLRGLLLVGAAAGGLTGCARRTDVAGAGGLPKFLALYRDEPNDGEQCAGCEHFLQPDACEIVAGVISPNGWCHYYEPA